MVSERKLNSKKYKAAMKNTGERCAYCGKKIDPESKWGLDHIIPVSQGGTDDFSNLVMSCMPCNSMKNNRDPEDWKAYLLDTLLRHVESLEKSLKKQKQFIDYKPFQKDQISTAIFALKWELEKLEIKFLLDDLDIGS